MAAILAAGCSVFRPVPNLSSASAGPKTEVLRLMPYPGVESWKKITDRIDSRGGTYREWIPSDQSIDAIHDILVEQVFYDTAVFPAAFLKTMLQLGSGACSGVRVNGPQLSSANGFDVAYGQLWCVGQIGTGMDVDTFIKIIRGNDALYVVQREFRRPATPGAKPGEFRFGETDWKIAARALVEARSKAWSYLWSSVELCPLTQTTGLCAETIRTLDSDATSPPSQR